MISLILLLVLMLVVTMGLQVTTMQEKMAGNMRDKDLAFQAAESALRQAEASLNPPAAYPTFSASGVNGYYTATSTIPTQSAIMQDSFWTSQPYKTSTLTNLGNGISAPVYIIQDMGCKAYPGATACSTSFPSNTFRITVKATGGSANTVVVLQSIYCPTNCGT